LIALPIQLVNRTDYSSSSRLDRFDRLVWSGF